MYQSAVQVAYDTVIHSFIIQTRTLLLLSLLLLLGAWISGPYKSATVVKNRITDLLSGHVHQSIFGNRENGFTTWVGRYKAYLQWGSVIVVAFIMILVQLSPKLVALYALLIIVLVLIVDLVAAPKTSQKI
jgi:membrane protein insertase Oxa1/YidC/SpoIIIJ